MHTLSDLLQDLAWLTYEECEAVNHEHPSCIRKARQIVACNEVRDLRCVKLQDGSFRVSAFVHSEYKNLWYDAKIHLQPEKSEYQFECCCLQRYGRFFGASESNF